MWHRVKTIQELPAYAEVAGKEIAVFRVAEKFFATNNFCPHRGGPLFRGVIEEGPSVRCPLHGWRFNLGDGQCLNMPNAKLNTYSVEVRGEEVFVEV